MRNSVHASAEMANNAARTADPTGTRILGAGNA